MRPRGRLPVARLAAVLAAVKAVVTARRTRAARADGGRIVHVAGGDLQVCEHGPQGAPAIVLLHGFDGSWHWWKRAAPLLAHGHRVLSFDLLGHGGSSKPRRGYSMENQAELVADAMRQLRVGDAVVAGHSMGASVAVALAAAHPALVRGVVIVAQPARSGDANFRRAERLVFAPLLGPLMFRTAPALAIREAFRVAFAGGFHVPGFVVRDHRRMTYSSFHSAAVADDAYLDAEPLDRRLIALGRPALVIFGRRERLLTRDAHRRYAGLEGVQVALVDDAGHSPMHEQPERTAALILAFERRLTATPGPRSAP